MDQPSSSRAPLLPSGGDSDGGERVERRSYLSDSNIRRVAYFTKLDTHQSLTPTGKSTIVEGVDANVLKLPREDQRFLFVEFSPDWSLVVTITSDGTFSVWDAKDEWVLVGLKRLVHDGHTLKCIAFDPYIKRAVLLCFDSGEICRANLKRVETYDALRSSRVQSSFHMERVYKCSMRNESRLDHFKFSSDRKILIYYNLDGEITAINFRRHDRPNMITLSRDLVIKQDPNIYISKQKILINAVLQSRKDPIQGDEKLKTLLWSKLDSYSTRHDNKPVTFEGKGSLSDDGKYMLTSLLAVEHQSACCQISVHLVENDNSITSNKHNLIAIRTLRLESNHPHLECLDWNQFRSLHADDIKTKPLIAIHQTNAVRSRLLFWDTNSDTLIFEIDLTLNKSVRKFSEIKYCWSSDCKWLGVCSFGARMIGLVCARSGVFVWTAKVPQIGREDVEFSGLSFDTLGTRLMIYLGKMICLFEPPCLSHKRQRHPVLHNLFLSQTSKTCDDFEILEMSKAWPKQLLLFLLAAVRGIKEDVLGLLLDVAISLDLKQLAMVCQRNEDGCLLFIIDYSKTRSMKLIWFLVLQRWNQHFLGNEMSPLVKEIKGECGQKCTSLFYYEDEATKVERIVLFSTKGGIEMRDTDCELKHLSMWERISDKSCFSLQQSKNRQRVIALADKSVLIVDVNKKIIINEVKYSFALSQWWESLLNIVQCFGYSPYHGFIERNCKKERGLLLHARFRGLFNVSDDGEKVLIGWDNERGKSIVITPKMSEEQFRTEWDEAHKSLYQCSMLTENGQWLGFIDYEKLRDGDIVACVVNHKSHRQRRIWLGSDESFVKLSSSQPLLAANFLFQIDKIEEDLTILVLERVKNRATVKKFSLKLLNEDECAPVHDLLLSTIVQPTTLDAYGEGDQPSTFNMRVTNISNFQRVLMEEGKDKLEIIARKALDNKIKVSDVYRFRRDKDHSDTTLLMHSLKKKETAMVQLCLDCIKDGLFTFHSASNMVKNSFFELLFNYNELIMPILRRNSFIYKIMEVKVPARVFQFQKAVPRVAFTCDTLLEPKEHYVQMAIKDLQKSKSSWHVRWAGEHEDERKVLSCVHLFYITNACKVGLNGIIRKLLMLQMPDAIFKTELLRATVNWKWERLWKGQCLRDLVLYVVFLVFFTSYALGIGLTGDKLTKNTLFKVGLSFPLLGAMLVALALTYKECMQLQTYMRDGKKVFGTHMWGLRHYFLDSQWNLIELVSYFLVLVLIPIFHCLYIFEIGSKKVLFVIVAIESILAWFKLWYFAQPFEKTGALVLLISNVILDCIPFLMLSFIVLLGFSIAFYVLFQCIENPSSINTPEGEEEGDLTQESFGSLIRSMSTLFYAMVGTFEVEVYYSAQSLSWFTTFIFILYMALEMIVMLNMLIAIMGDTFDRVKNEEDVKIVIGRARFMDSYEASLSVRQIRAIEKKIGNYLFVLTPKDGEHIGQNTNWKGRISVIEENVTKAIDSLEANIVKRIENNTKGVDCLETNVMKGIEDNKETINEISVEMEHKMQERFLQMELALQKTAMEYEATLIECKGELEKLREGEEERKTREEEHCKKEKEALLSIEDKVKNLEVETNKLLSSMKHQFGEDETNTTHYSFIHDDLC